MILSVFKFLITIAILTASLLYAQVPACVNAQDPSCKESFDVGAYHFSYFRSFTLNPGAPNTNITRAVIVLHGMERDAPVYFQAVVDALDNKDDPTLLVIAPHFKGWVRNSPTCNDALDTPSELHWSCTGSTSINRWDDGGQARDTASDVIYSFSMIDRLLDILNSGSFPNLQKITITGHSDGAQFTQRYAAGNQKDGTIPAAIKYVIANPGSYMYLDERRLPKGETCFTDGTCTVPDPAFTADWDPNPDPNNQCLDTYNNYKYGLEARTFGYMNWDPDHPEAHPGFSKEEVKARFLARNIAYLLGENDQSGASPLDVSCPANAQGSHTLEDGTGFVGGRRERGTIFWNYIQRLGATHTLTIVPTCDHNGTCMYGRPETVQAILF